EKPETKASDAKPRPSFAASEPLWETRAANSLDEAESAVLEQAPGTGNVCVFTNRRTLRVFNGDGELIHESEAMVGLGRILRTYEPPPGEEGGWLAAATNGVLVAYDPLANESIRSAVSITDLSHLVLLPTFGEAYYVEECENLVRFRFPDEERSSVRSDFKIETFAAQPDGSYAATFENKLLQSFDATGKSVGKFRAKPAEPLMAAPRPGGGWATAARDSRAVRGHEPDGSLVWAIDLPWGPWSLRPMGSALLATSPEGYSALVSGEGRLIAENREPRDQARYFVLGDGSPARLFLADQTVIVTSFEGRLLWRYTAEETLGPVCAGSAGVWMYRGRVLSFFPFYS
ncbi:MAG: hypothetical protein ACRC1K_04420, partial [Planctomycetia bacterium]